MGQATITAERGEGLYEILIDRGLGRIAGQIEAIDLRILELEGEVEDAQKAIDDALTSGEREQLQVELDDAIAAYRLAVDERCTQESYQIPDLSEFQEAYAGIREAEDAYFKHVNVIGKLNNDLAQATNDAFKAEQDIAFWTARRDELQEGLDYFEDLYTQAFEAAVDCATKGTNCEPNWLFTLQELLTWFGVAVMAYNDAVNAAQDRINDAQDELEDANSREAELNAEIEAANEPLEDLKEALDEARREYQAVVTKLRPLSDICDPRQFVAEQDVVDKAAKALGEYDIEMTRLKGVLGLALAHLLSARLQRARLQEAVEESIIYREAWCLDYTTGATGSIGTVEIPGEPQNVLIVPGAVAPTEQEGFLLHRAAMTPAQSAFNLAVLPGWQKWKPMYRVGTLVDKDDALNLGSVELDEARSSATGVGTISPITGEDWGGPDGDRAGLMVNQGPLGWLEFDYMWCDSLAFQIGDRVVVRFESQAWSNDAYIVGFEREPRLCGAYGLTAWPVVASRRRLPHPGGPFPNETYEEQSGIYIGGTSLGFGPWHWGRMQYTGVVENNFNATLRAGTVEFSDGWIDVGRIDQFGTAAVGIRENRPNLVYAYETDPARRQYRDGAQCPDWFESCQPGRAEWNYWTWSRVIDIPTTITPLSDPRVAEVVSLLGIPLTNAFAPEWGGVGPLVGLSMKWGTWHRILAWYDLPD